MRKGPRNFRFLFVAGGMTRYGGLLLFRQFCKSLGLRYFLQHHVQWPRYHHRGYHPADLFLAHLFAITAGIGRVENTQTLLHNGLIPPLLGLPNFPHRDTLRTFLWRFTEEDLRSLRGAHDKLRSKMFLDMDVIYNAVVDADTTTLITYGRQEGVAKGYIPKRRHHQHSYAPVLASEGRSGVNLGADLRPGNIHASTGAWDFLKPILDRLPSTIASSRTRVRLDGAFYDKAIVQQLDGMRLGYTVVAKMTGRLKKKMIAARYHEFARGWEAAEFSYTPFHWNVPHRFVAVRKPVGFESEEVQRHLFTLKRHTYHRALVTNLDLMPEAVYRFYCNRWAQELLIREFKDAYNLAQIPTRSFHANAAYLEMILWAYDLVLAFQHLCLPAEVRHWNIWNISMLRRELWWLPAEWVRRGNRNCLRLPARYPRQDLFRRIQTAASRVKPLT